MKKKPKKVLGIFLAVVLTSVLIYLGLNKNVDQAYSMKLDNFERHLVELETERETIDEVIKTVYADEDQTYILQSLKEKKIDEIKEGILMYEEKFVDLKEELQDLTARDQKKYTKKMKASKINSSLENYYISIDDLKIKKELTDSINDLFSKEYMKGEKVDLDIFINKTLDSSQFMRTYNLVNQKLNKTELKNINEYSKTLYEGLKIAEEQLDHLNQAIELRDELFNENDFLVITDSKKIEEFHLAVKKIKNPELKSTFDEYIRKTEGYDVEEQEEIEDTGELDLSDSDDEETDQYEEPSNIDGPTNSWTPETGQSNNNKGNSNSKPMNPAKPNKPGAGESGKPGAGESDKPDTGGSDKPGAEESEKPGAGESGKPGAGESEKPGHGESEKPDDVEPEKPGNGNTEDKDEGGSNTEDEKDPEVPSESIE